MARPKNLIIKDARLQIRLTKEDKKAISKKAIDMEMSISEFLIYSAKKVIKEGE